MSMTCIILIENTIATQTKCIYNDKEGNEKWKQMAYKQDSIYIPTQKVCNQHRLLSSQTTAGMIRNSHSTDLQQRISGSQSCIKASRVIYQ